MWCRATVELQSFYVSSLQCLRQFVDALLSRLTGSMSTSQAESLPRVLASGRLAADMVVDLQTLNARRRRWEGELRTLFKKIDASCSESVTWEASGSWLTALTALAQIRGPA